MTSAQRLEGSTNSRCIGRTVARYWRITSSSVRPRSAMSRWPTVIVLQRGVEVATLEQGRQVLDDRVLVKPQEAETKTKRLKT